MCGTRGLSKINRVLSILILSLWSFSAIAQTPREQFKDYPTGLDKAEMDRVNARNKFKITRVKPNDLALQRKNDELARQGRPLIDRRTAVDRENEITMVPVSGGADSSSSLQGEVVTALATGVDNSTLSAFPPIGSQGGEGSCFPFNVTYYLMSHETCLVRGCNNKSGDLTNIFSPRWIYNQVNQGANLGCCQGKLWEVLENHGAPNLYQLPYISGDYRTWDLNTNNWIAALSNRMNRFAPINITTGTGVSNLKQWLANGHVAMVGTYIYSFVYVYVGNNPSAPSPYAGQWVVSHLNGASGGHAMTVVGYDDELWVDINNNGAVDANEQGAFKVVNSWGTGYSNGGWVWVSYDAFKSVTAVAGGPSSGRVAFTQDGNAWTSTAKLSYTPKILAQFTVNHGLRNQLGLNIGTSSTSATSPSTLWNPAMIQFQGGAMGFDGSANAVDGTFVFDFSDLVPAGSSSLKYYFQMTDNTSGSPAVLKDFRIIDVARGQTIVYNGSLPVQADASTSRVSVSYSFTDGNIPPVAILSGSSQTSGSSVLAEFDGSGSYDPDGSLAGYSWNFGDGTSQIGNSTASHTYTRAGNFTATLTVTDNKGATGSASYVVSIPDTEAPTAPTNLAAQLVTTSSRGKSKRGTTTTSVKLTWTAALDNVGVARYLIYRNGTLLTSTTSTSLTDSSTAAGGGSYNYTVIAVDAADNQSASSNVATISR